MLETLYRNKTSAPEPDNVLTETTAFNAFPVSVMMSFIEFQSHLPCYVVLMGICRRCVIVNNKNLQV